MVSYGSPYYFDPLIWFSGNSWKLVEPGEETADSTAGIRVLMFDRIMEKYVDDMEQIVLPGVGFDLIALHFTKGKKVEVLELDQINSLNVKVETLNKAGIKHDWITYIPVDYSNESWADKLFGVFQRLHHADEFEGTGIGLAAASRMITQI